MSITLSRDFVSDTLKSCPDGRRRAETCRDIAAGYRRLAKRKSEMAKDWSDKANNLMELARRLDANAAQPADNPNHPRQLWNNE